MFRSRPVANSLLECPVTEIHEWSDRIQSTIWNVHKSTGWQWFRAKWIPMTIMKYFTSNIFEVNMDTRVNRVRNCFSKPRELNDDNLSECLQRSVVLEYEGKRNGLLSITNNKVLSLIRREHDSTFRRRNRDSHIHIFSNSLIIKLTYFSHIWNIHNPPGWQEFRKKWMALVTIQYVMLDISSHHENHG
jgi:hypothetical protein